MTATGRSQHRLLMAALLALCLAGVPASAQFSAKWMAEQMAEWLLVGPLAEGLVTAGVAEKELEGIEGDYDPEDYPVLSSQCAANPDCKLCLKQPSDTLSDDFFLGENNYVLYLRTMKKYEMMVALADAAASLPSDYARYAWLLRKGSPNSGMNQAKAQFESHYGEAQKNHLKNINEALLTVAKCESPYDNAWFNRVGMPFYTQLLLRWTSVK